MVSTTDFDSVSLGSSPKVVEKYNEMVKVAKEIKAT